MPEHVLAPADWRERILDYTDARAADRVVQQILDDPGLLFIDDDEEALAAEQVPADVYRAAVRDARAAFTAPGTPTRSMRRPSKARRRPCARRRSPRRRNRTARRRNRRGASGDSDPPAALARRLEGWRA